MVGPQKLKSFRLGNPRLRDLAQPGQGVVIVTLGEVGPATDVIVMVHGGSVLPVVNGRSGPRGELHQ